jgi:hypothetical protein
MASKGLPESLRVSAPALTINELCYLDAAYLRFSAVIEPRLRDADVGATSDTVEVLACMYLTVLVQLHRQMATADALPLANDDEVWHWAREVATDSLVMQQIISLGSEGRLALISRTARTLRDLGLLGAEATSVSLYATTLVVLSFVSSSNDDDAPSPLLQSYLSSALDNVCEVLINAIGSPAMPPIMQQTVVALDVIATTCSRSINPLALLKQVIGATFEKARLNSPSALALTYADVHTLALRAARAALPDVPPATCSTGVDSLAVIADASLASLRKFLVVSVVAALRQSTGGLVALCRFLLIHVAHAGQSLRQEAPSTGSKRVSKAVAKQARRRAGPVGEILTLPRLPSPAMLVRVSVSHKNIDH